MDRGQQLKFRKLNRQIKALEKEIEFYTDKIQNVNDWFKDSNITNFKKQRRKFINKRDRILYDHPEYFL